MKKFLIILVCLGLVGCATMPLPVKSSIYKVTGGGFGFQADKPEETISYSISLKVIKPLDKTVFVEIEFENPCNSKEPLIVTKILQPSEEEFFVTSPPVRCFKAGHYYTITVRTYDSQAKTEPLDMLRQKLYFWVNTKDMLR